MAMALGALAAAFLIGAIVFGAMMVMAKDKEIDRLTKSKNDMESTIRLHDPDLKIVKAVDEWSASDINWLDELYDMTSRMDDRMIRSINVMDLNGSPLDERSAKSKFVATLALKLITTADDKPFEKLRGELNMETHFRIPAFQPKPNTGRERQRFPREYSGKIDIAKRKPEEHTLSFTATPPKRSTDDGAGLFDMGGFGP